MLIGQVIEQCGVTRDTIRHYEAKGLIEMPERRDNNYKDYPQNTVNRVKFIRDMQGVGFTLRQTREMLVLFDEGAATCANTGPKIHAHREQLDEKIAQLTAMRENLDTYFGGCQSSSLEGACTPITDPLAGV